MRQQQTKKVSMISQLLIILSIALVFGSLAFLYSIFGFFEQTKNIVVSDTYRALNIQEIGGHFVFGFIVGIPTKKFKIAILTGLMALTIDFDHLLYVIGSNNEGRLAHSIPFAILSSVLISIMITKIRNKASLTNNNSIKENKNNIFKRNPRKMAAAISSIFSPFFLITLAAFLSHIAYDVFLTDGTANFPLFAPFSFAEFGIPRMYGLPIEESAFVSIVLYCIHSRYYTKNSSFIEL
jgi:LexA-binding, inner membrane-associated putative hydrolase